MHVAMPLAGKNFQSFVAKRNGVGTRMNSQASRRDVIRYFGAGVGLALVPDIWGQTHLTHSTGLVNVKDFDATGDGHTLDTPAINRAIEDAASKGGGTVWFPSGSYLCYSIRLKSNVALYLDAGCTIVAADTPMEGYPAGSSNGYDAAEPDTAAAAYQDYGHNHWRNSLIWGEDLHDIAILGTGIIWGRGLSRGAYKDTPVAEKPGVGNKAIGLKNCRNVTLKDFSILKGGHFGVLLTGVDNVTVDNLKIDTNRDGIDIDCCKNVRVSNCSVNSPWDDGICPKSSFALGYARVTENVTITNCYVTGKYETGGLLDGTYRPLTSETAPGHKLFYNGRIKCGTESNGGFRNITISNCVLEKSRGFALQSMDGAQIEDISITNITMREASDGPFYIRLGARMRGPGGAPIGTIRRVRISNLTSHDAITTMAGMIQGLPGHAVEDISLSDIYCHQIGGASAFDGIPPEANPKGTEPGSFPHQPAHGLFVRHAKNLEASNLEFAVAAKDARPAVWMEDIHGADFFAIRVPSHSTAFDLHGVSRVHIFGSPAIQDLQSDGPVSTTLHRSS